MFSIFLLLVSSFLGFGKEGFFKPEQVNLPFNAQTLRSKSALVEEYRQGRWQHIGNAHFVGEKGILLTNYHIAATCVQTARRELVKFLPSLRLLARQGFSPKIAQAVSCHHLRIRVGNKWNSPQHVRLLFLPKVNTEQPIWDFALLVATDITNAEHYNVLDAPAVAINESVFSPGYPARTDRKDSSPLVSAGIYDDVKTADFRLTQGKRLPYESTFFGESKQEYFYYTDTDGGSGSSGSALLNDKGEWVGLIQGSGDPKSTLGNCNPAFIFCDGVSLYIRGTHIRNVLRKEAPQLVPFLK